MRSINKRFIDDLRKGDLAFFLQQVKENRERMSLEIRNGYVNIYYRGGNLMKISQNKKGYSFHFDTNYCKNKNDDSNFEELNSLDKSSISDYQSHFTMMMKEMDSWLKVHPKTEREYQQKLTSRNLNIIDIEYQINYKDSEGKGKALRLDMIMHIGGALIIVENKYGNGAISGKAGLAKHYRDICMVLADEALYRGLRKSMTEIFSAKCELGLMEEPVMKLNIEKTEILFLLVDYSRGIDTLTKEKNAMDATIPARILFLEKDEYLVDLEKSRDFFADED